LADHEIVTWFKAEHAMGHGHAKAPVGRTLGEDAESYVEAVDSRVAHFPSWMIRDSQIVKERMRGGHR
jgi:hypothetical protein